MRILERVTCFLLILFIPIQLGKHFWPYYAFVSGIRVDYLSPTLFLTDIFLVFLLAVFFYNLWKERKVPVGLIFVLLCFAFTSFASFFRSEFYQAFLYLFIRVSAYIGFGYVIARNTSRSFLRLVLIGMICVCVLVVVVEFVQFVGQGSVGGMLYWIGERNLSLSTPGIALFSLDGHLLLRPYAAFPHPNVLAWYIFFCLVSARYLIFTSETKIQRILFGVLYITAMAGLLFTFSRILILCGFLLLMLDTIQRKRILLVMICMVFFFGVFHNRFFSERTLIDVKERINYALPILNMGYDYFLFGLGLNQYFYHQIEVQRELSPFLLQPVHNSYFLIFLQTGILGVSVILIGLAVSFRRILKLKMSYERELVFLLFVTLLFAAFFDHYFVTLHQGMLLTALVLGIVWSQSVSARE